jgi:prephenate dehydrogenase
MWRDILVSNRGHIGDQLKAFRATLDRIEAALEKDADLQAELTDAARYRLNVPRDLPGLHKPENELIVRVVDEPGALAAVTTALAREQINIRDIQVLKVRQDEDGVLRLAFAKKKETQRAAEILRKAGHHVKLRT